ncbi:MAG: putative addiction module antidote protein [Propionibacteriaceae bacterium]|nr:putative addiction module antidote protein [Propionibacteriaceae bacterium]
MNIRTSKWDASEYLSSAEDVVDYLNAAIEENDPAVLQAALGDVAKAQGMSQIAQDAGVGRESLYKSLRSDGTPSFKTIAKVVRALGVRIVFEPVPHADPEREASDRLVRA